LLQFLYKQNNNQMKNNAELQKDVQDAIKWEPLLTAAEIGVTAKDGIVTLTGIVDTYAKKSEAEDAAKNVAGVKAVVEKIEIRLAGASGKKDDNELAISILNALKYNWQVPDDKIRLEVEKGWVILEGELQWNYQKEVVKDVVKNMVGVTGITNNISIKTESSDEIEKDDIEKALSRNWSVNNHDIQVNVSGNRVTLTGDVKSWYQRGEAERMAWNAPGVWNVDNQLVIDYDYSLSD
jgi:osmotically-inducible protein OsmY